MGEERSARNWWGRTRSCFITRFRERARLQSCRNAAKNDRGLTPDRCLSSRKHLPFDSPTVPSPFPFKHIGVESPAMKIVACFALISAIFAPGLVAQTKTNSAASHQPYEIQISAGVAEKLLIHKADFVCSTLGRYTRIEAIVVVAIGIDKNGDVLHPTVVSGPQIVRKAVLDAVRKYKYKPYLLNGNAVEVETTVSVDTGRDHFCFPD